MIMWCCCVEHLGAQSVSGIHCLSPGRITQSDWLIWHRMKLFQKINYFTLGIITSVEQRWWLYCEEVSVLASCYHVRVTLGVIPVKAH